MKEDFLQAIWQLQYYTLPAISSCGMEIQVIRPGIQNRENGPDFLQACLVMDGLEWNGSVEVHVRAGEWKQHGHHRDAAYDSVVLHVVWEEDQPVFRSDGSKIPTLELRDRIPLAYMLNYRKLLARKDKLSCSAMLAQIPEVIKNSMLDAALADRLSRRAREIRSGKPDSCRVRSTARWLARCLGMPGNEDRMEWLVQSLPDSVIGNAKLHADLLHNLLLWLAGFAAAPVGKEQEVVSFISRTEPMQMLWQCGSIRPLSFPKVRIKLLAALLPLLEEWQKSGSMIDFISFAGSRGIALSPQMKNHLMVNFDIPFRPVLLWESDGEETIQPDIDKLYTLKAEVNAITRKMQRAGFILDSAAHTQGAKELHDYWCRKKKCMECRIGIAALGRTISAE